MRIAPQDVRRARFSSAVRGFNRPEVLSFLNEVADGFEQALRATDRLRQEVADLQAQLAEHRQREASLRDTLLTARRISAEMHESATQEAQLIVREARGRADELTRKAGAQCQDVEREITDLRRQRTDVEASVEGSIMALRHALEFMKQLDRERSQGDNIRQHQPRSNDSGTAIVGPAPHPVIAAVESQPSA